VTVGMRDFVGELAREPLLFRETFRSQASVEENGATLVGTGTTFGGDGVTFNGSGNLLYNVSMANITRPSMTIVFDFTWGEAINVAAQRVWFGSGSLEWVLFKQSSGGNHIIDVYFGGTRIFSVAYAVWSIAVVAGKNTFVISATSGANSIWLNGVLLQSSAFAWTPTRPSSLYIGSYIDLGSRVVGTFHRFEIYGSAATAVDEPYLRAGTVVAALDPPLVVLPGTSSYYRPSTTNLVVDGNMEAVGTAAYTAAFCALSKVSVPPPYSGTQCLRVTADGTGNAFAYQTILTAGLRYRVTGWARGDGLHAPTVYDTGTLLWTGTTSTTWQNFSVVFTAGGTQIRLYSHVHAGDYCDYDDVAVNLMQNVTEVQGKSGITEALMGSTGLVPAEFPAILRPRGFSFDGGDQINLGDNDQFSFTNGVNDLPFSAIVLCKFNSVANIGIAGKASSFTVGEWFVYTTGLGGIGFVLVDNTTAGSIYASAPNGTLALGVNYTIAVTYAGAGFAGLRIYVNGTRVDTIRGNYNAGYVIMRNTTEPLRVGSTIAVYMNGSITLPIIDNVEWSPLQVKSLSARMLREARTS